MENKKQELIYIIEKIENVKVLDYLIQYIKMFITIYDRK